MGNYNEEEYPNSFSTEATTNMASRNNRMKQFIALVGSSGEHLPKKQLLAMFSLKAGVRLATVYEYLTVYTDALLVDEYDGHIMMMEVCTKKREQDTARLKELAGQSDEVD